MARNDAVPGTIGQHSELRRMQLDSGYWGDRYANNETGWDLGGPSTPLKEYLDQLTDKEIRILIPGGGRAYEAEHAHRLGFRNIFVIDLTDAPFKDLLARCPDFPKEQLILGDFFAHNDRYDRILEQTFFCALDPSLRERYVAHMHDLLNPGGKLVGVLFNEALDADKPPFGGDREAYLPLFRKHFPTVTMEPCQNSIPPRAGRELWLCARKDNAYAPIDCSLYDRYEEAATLKRNVTLTLTDGTELSVVIVDLFIRDKVEWMRSGDQREIRLDAIASMRDTND